jgi:assimilatory nitrate reductase catalytic subunit
MAIIRETSEAWRSWDARYFCVAVAVYGGASLTTEKAYLMGKFARVALGTRHIDYNGRLCMVSAGVAYKGMLGVDRAPNPWSDIPKAEVVMAIGANIGECAPITFPVADSKDQP